MRYKVVISFKRGTRMFDNVEDLEEEVSSAKEVRKFKAMVDDTVQYALVTDNVTGETTDLEKF